jgi:hypothetical protein
MASDIDQGNRARMNRALAAGENASVGAQAMAANGVRDEDFSSDPQPQRMGSGDHLGPQFDGFCQTQTEPEVPAVHSNPAAYYGEDQDTYGGGNA